MFHQDETKSKKGLAELYEVRTIPIFFDFESILIEIDISMQINLLLILFFQDDYAQKAGIAPAPLSISDELKKEVSNYWLLARKNGNIVKLVLVYSLPQLL